MEKVGAQQGPLLNALHYDTGSTRLLLFPHCGLDGLVLDKIVKNRYCKTNINMSC